MDMNELLHAHQIAAMKADRELDRPLRLAYLETVSLYAERIHSRRKRWQRDLPFSRDLSHSPLVSARIEQSKTASRSLRASSAIDNWESEGGALEPRLVRMPAGITTHLVPHYRVGSFVYSDPDLAIAEYVRQKNKVPSPEGASLLGQSSGVDRDQV